VVQRGWRRFDQQGATDVLWEAPSRLWLFPDVRFVSTPRRTIMRTQLDMGSP
jgi:hypothetical protein